MKYPFIFICIIFFSSLFTPLGGYAVSPPTCDPKLYSCYLSNIVQCTDKAKPWMGNFDLGATSQCPYPEFTVAGMNGGIACIQAQEAKNPTAGYRENITPDQIGGFQGFRAAEIARRYYRKNMNTIFSCGVIASRQDKLLKLEVINKKNGGASDIQKSLEKEQKKYKLLMENMNCNKNNDNMTAKGDDKIVDRLSSSAMIEYCKYTYYLEYLDKNIETDFTQAMSIDTNIGSSSGALPMNTIDANNVMMSYTTAVENERIRAKTTLPKAVMAFQEMDRTYIIHILLVIIYDDYVKLRDNLNTYMSIVSQTFEKAYNAQDENN